MKFMKTAILLLLISFLSVSCKKTRGCTDPEALNYNKDAVKDDHTCYYYWIGQKYGGGKIFYIDQTKKQGLIAADFDLVNSPWGCGGTAVSGADGTIVGAGTQNTLDIVAGCSSGSAASLCNDLDTFGFDDWFLPSVEEMKGLYKTFGMLGEAHLTSGYYWTSNQFDAVSATTMMFANGTFVDLNKNAGYRVRAIRKFQ
jgi:hypothetical protein